MGNRLDRTFIDLSVARAVSHSALGRIGDHNIRRMVTKVIIDSAQMHYGWSNVHPKVKIKVREDFASLSTSARAGV